MPFAKRSRKGVNACPLTHGLTARERAVLDARDDGLSNAKIAARLGLSVSTVASILRKFAGDDRRLREAAIRASTDELGRRVRAYWLRRGVAL